MSRLSWWMYDLPISMSSHLLDCSCAYVGASVATITARVSVVVISRDFSVFIGSRSRGLGGKAFYVKAGEWTSRRA